MPNSTKKASADTKALVSESKLIAALDALVLKDVGNKELERVPEEADSDVEIVAFGPVPIKPKNLVVKGVRRVQRDVAGENKQERFAHPFFSKTSSSKQKTTGRSMAQQTGVQNTRNNAARSAPNLNSGPAVSTFPLYSYKEYMPTPTVVYTRHEEETNELIATLKHGPVGFDIEWRVILRNGSKPLDHRVAVVQVADGSGLILVIQIHPMSRFPKKLQELIENEEIPKLGVNITNDGTKLFKDYGILAKNLLELGKLLLLADPVGAHPLTHWRTKTPKWMIALAKLVEHYFGKTLNKDKKLRMGNWEAELEQPQIDYAANDAHCALKLYDRLLELAQQQHIELDAELIKRQCSSSVTSPYPKALIKSVSCSEIPSKDSTAKSGSVQRSGTMPIMPSESTTRPPQHLRAYRYWHERGMSMEKMCTELSLKSKGYGSSAVRKTTTLTETEYNEDGNLNPALHSDALKPSTVISYVVGALQADPRLPFKMEKLRELVQMDAGSWERHYDWILQAWNDGRGVW